jgi:hypothetical protein
MQVPSTALIKPLNMSNRQQATGCQKIPAAPPQITEVLSFPLHRLPWKFTIPIDDIKLEAVAWSWQLAVGDLVSGKVSKTVNSSPVSNPSKSPRGRLRREDSQRRQAR